MKSQSLDDSILEKFDSRDNEDILIKRLELYEGSWAINLKRTLYVFPPDTTREQAEKALKKAWNLYKNRMN